MVGGSSNEKIEPTYWPILIWVLEALIVANEKFVVGLGGGGKHMLPADKKKSMFLSQVGAIIDHCFKK